MGYLHIPLSTWSVEGLWVVCFSLPGSVVGAFIPLANDSSNHPCGHLVSSAASTCIERPALNMGRAGAIPFSHGGCIFNVSKLKCHGVELL